MSLADVIASGPVQHASPMRRGIPREFAAFVDLDRGNAAINVTHEISQDEASYRKAIEESAGVTIPDDVTVELTGVRVWTMGEVTNHHLTFKFTPRSTVSTVDIEALVKAAKEHARKTPPKSSTAATRTRIVAASDEQLGKVDRRGGTAAFFTRYEAAMVELEAEMKARPASEAVICLGGDLVEGFENTGAQAFTNDLSHPEMLAVARRYLTDLITRIAARHEHVRVLAVPSNHGAWRRGKDNLGTPADDYGLDCVRAVAEALAMSERWSHVQFLMPEPWEVSLAIPVRDDILALTHGHVGTSSPGGFKKWFAGQAMGDSPIARATIVLSGHYHHYISEPLGNIGDRQRRHIQLPALDGGSSWFTNATGEWSPPGIWTGLVIDEVGLDFERVIRA